MGSCYLGVGKSSIVLPGGGPLLVERDAPTCDVYSMTKRVQLGILRIGHQVPSVVAFLYLCMIW